MKGRLGFTPEIHVVRVQRKGYLTGLRRLQRRGDLLWVSEHTFHILWNGATLRGQEMVCVLVAIITCPFLGQILRNNTGEINYNFIAS